MIPRRRAAQGRRLPSSLLVCALATLLVSGSGAACVHQRSVTRPVPGALETTFPDSAHYVIRAAEHAIGDEGLTILFDDRKRGFIQTRPVGAGMLRAHNPGGNDYSGPDGIVTFRLWAVQLLGVTQVTAEAVYQPVRGGGRVSERMVPPDHVGREVIARFFASMQKRLEDEREERERKRSD